LRHVLNVFNDQRYAVTSEMRLLAILSLREVFLDIIPDYVIREHNLEKGKGENLLVLTRCTRVVSRNVPSVIRFSVITWRSWEGSSYVFRDLYVNTSYFTQSRRTC
jgi:hypothetical protein